MEVSQLKEKFDKLSNDITEQIRQFEEETETKITYVAINRAQTLGTANGELVGVELQIELW